MYARLRKTMLLTIWILTWTLPAWALTVGISEVEGGFFYRFSNILYSGDTEPVFTLHPETGEVSFGDGELGARPPAGQGVIATYRQGTGAVGNIYQVTSDFHPFLIPWEAFVEDDAGKLDVSLIVAGVEKMAVQTGGTGVKVAGVALVPLPGTLGLLVSGLLSWWAGRRRKARI